MYEKQIWSDVYGETPFTSERMNHIEDGIYNAYKAYNITKPNTNLDDYMETGTYFFRNSSVTPINIPAGSNGWLLVLKGDDAHCKQIWFRLGSEPNHYQTFIRTCLSGTWTTWVSLTFGN